jgi:hypothetical protein
MMLNQHLAQCEEQQQEVNSPTFTAILDRLREIFYTVRKPLTPIKGYIGRKIQEYTTVFSLFSTIVKSSHILRLWIHFCLIWIIAFLIYSINTELLAPKLANLTQEGRPKVTEIEVDWRILKDGKKRTHTGPGLP